MIKKIISVLLLLISIPVYCLGDKFKISMVYRKNVEEGENTRVIKGYGNEKVVQYNCCGLQLSFMDGPFQGFYCKSCFTEHFHGRDNNKSAKSMVWSWLVKMQCCCARDLN